MANRSIQEAVLHLSGNKNTDTVSIVECTVDSVSVSARTCDCTTLDGIKISGVRLMSTVDDGVLIIPAVGSDLIVGYTKKIVPFVCQFSSVDKVLVITGDTTIEIKDGLVKFNDGSFDGLVKIKDLVTKLNNIETKLNTIIAWGAMVTPPLFTSPMINTQKSDIENTLITHGK